MQALILKFSSAGSKSVTPFEVSADPKAFATGSFGWGHHKNKKIEAATGSFRSLFVFVLFDALPLPSPFVVG